MLAMIALLAQNQHILLIPARLLELFERMCHNESHEKDQHP
jgi:hypothetical protein